MKSLQNKNRTIVFRVTEEIWQKANEISALANKSINDWARDEIVGGLSANSGLTPGENLLYIEVANLRNLVETMMVGELFEDEKTTKYQEALEQSLNSRETAVQDYFQAADSQVINSPVAGSQITDSQVADSQTADLQNSDSLLIN